MRATSKMRQRSSLLWLPALLLAIGCYRYVPIASGAPALGTEFRAQLTDEGTIRLAPLLGNQVTVVEGRMSASNDSAYVVSVTSTTNRSQVQTFWTGESVHLPRAAVRTIESRELNRRKTWFVAALGVAGGFFAAKIFDLFGGSAEGSGGGGPPPPPS
jgi:hypothetical protein